MKHKTQINQIIKSIQKEKNISRTSVLHYLISKYDISYTSLFAVAKRSHLPKQKRLIRELGKIIKDYTGKVDIERTLKLEE